jgi:hypothetical protein
MNNLTFSTNWNKKLNCKFFTTFRLFSPDIHYIGAEFHISCSAVKDQIQDFKGVIKLFQIFKLRDVPPILCYLDTGYSKDQFIKIVETMYKNKPINIYDIDFSFLLIERQEIINLSTTKAQPPVK